MRIKRKKTPAPKWGRLGKIKVGKTVIKNDKTIPVSTDHFVFTSDHAHRLEKMKTLFGDKPTTLPVTFHTNEESEVCDEKFELRNNKGQLVAYGDGENFMRSTKNGWQAINVEESRGLQQELYMPVMNGKRAFTAKWEEVLTLRVIVLGFPELGVWEFTTKGKETSIVQIRDCFDAILSRCGRVVLMPFRLVTTMAKSNRAEANRRYPVVNLFCDVSIDVAEQVLGMGNEINGLVTLDKLKNIKELPPEKKEEIEEAEVIKEN